MANAFQIISFSGEVRAFDATDPAELEAFIIALSELVEELPERIADLREAKYTTERAWGEKKSAQLAYYMAEHKCSATEARARAIVDAIPEQKARDEAKNAWHLATDQLASATSRLMAMQNVNKSNHAVLKSYGHGR